MLLVLFAACAPSTSYGTSEPIVVRDATFHAGAMPTDDSATTPSVVYAASAGFVTTQGNGDISYSGLASPDAWSIGVTFPSVSSGYWTVGVNGPDVTQDDDQLFKLVADFTPEVPYGMQTLEFVAFDGDGVVGPAYDTQLCVLPEEADGNYAVCDDSVMPQIAVIALTWDTEVDLDLIVLTPDGKQVDAKSPTTVAAGEDGTVSGDDLDADTTGYLSRDSNANCVIDGIRAESLVFPGEPPPGDYQVYADLYSDCGEPWVHFDLDLYQRVDAADGTHPVTDTALATGELLASQADAGASVGTFLATVTLP
jgi:hypothetical protein